MIDLSHAAIAVDDALAACIQLQGEIIRARPLAAAALRALADQVVPVDDWPDQSIGFADWNLATERCEQRKNIRAEILAIAAELESTDEPTFTPEEIEMIQAPWSYLQSQQELEGSDEA